MGGALRPRAHPEGEGPLGLPGICRQHMDVAAEGGDHRLQLAVAINVTKYWVLRGGGVRAGQGERRLGRDGWQRWGRRPGGGTRRCALLLLRRLPGTTRPPAHPAPPQPQSQALTLCICEARCVSHTSLPAAVKAARLPRASPAISSSRPSLLMSATATCACGAAGRAGRRGQMRGARHGGAQARPASTARTLPPRCAQKSCHPPECLPSAAESRGARCRGSRGRRGSPGGREVGWEGVEGAGAQGVGS